MFEPQGYTMQHHIDDIMQIEWNKQQVFSTMEALGRQKYSIKWEVKLNQDSDCCHLSGVL